MHPYYRNTLDRHVAAATPKKRMISEPIPTAVYLALWVTLLIVCGVLISAPR